MQNDYKPFSKITEEKIESLEYESEVAEEERGQCIQALLRKNSISLWPSFQDLFMKLFGVERKNVFSVFTYVQLHNHFLNMKLFLKEYLGSFLMSYRLSTGAIHGTKSRLKIIKCVFFDNAISRSVLSKVIKSCPKIFHTVLKRAIIGMILKYGRTGP